MSSSSLIGSDTSSSNNSSASNSPTNVQQNKMPAPQIDIQQILMGLNPLQPHSSMNPPLSHQSTTAPFQLLEALAKTGLLSQLNAMKQAEIANQLNGTGMAAFGGEQTQQKLPHKNATLADDDERNRQNPMPGQQHQRKRRRIIGNLDNTLDGLVAKRAEQMPIKRRYQSETEAIELPDDEVEIKRMEADPDVCTRMCSVCGYQGKWVSEMIRHKRVHTNDRPFKCKYCNRTSKWKADLIRHVAKTHGIRVVSKYSRSKAFEIGNKKQQQQNGQNDGQNVGAADEILMLADDVIVLGGIGEDGGAGEGGGSSAASDCGSGHSSQDENNNHIHNGGADDGTGKGGNIDGKKNEKPLNASNECSLNSLFRKAQRLNNLNRTNEATENALPSKMVGQKNVVPPPSSMPTSPPFFPSAQSSFPPPFNPKTQSLLNFLGGAGIGYPQPNANLFLADIVAAQQKKAAMDLGANVYKCGQCPFEEVSFPVLVSHLHAVHRVAPFVCQVCTRSFNELVTAGEHFRGQCSPLALKSNFVMKTVSAATIPADLKQFPNFPMAASNLLSKLTSTSTTMIPFSAVNHLAAMGSCLFPAFPFNGTNNTFLPSAQQFTSSASLTTTIPGPTSSAGPNCGSPVSILSTAPSFDSLHSMLMNEEKQSEIGKNEETFEDGKANSIPDELEIPSGDDQIDGHHPSKEIPSMNLSNNIVVDLNSAKMASENNSMLFRNTSAFKPVNASSMAQQQLDSTSLAAFGQFLAELQRCTKS